MKKRKIILVSAGVTAVLFLILVCLAVGLSRMNGGKEVEQEAVSGEENVFEDEAEETPVQTETAEALAAAPVETTARDNAAAEEIQTTEETVDDAAVEAALAELTLEEKVAQLFFITPEALTGYSTVTSAGTATKEALTQTNVGGLVYFAQNLVSPEQTKTMLTNVQDYAMEQHGLPIFLGVDEEGGRVLRVGSNSAFQVEKVEAMGELAKQQDTDVIYEAADTIGQYLSELGFNVDFAPDADVLTNEENQVIGDRSFGTDPDVVADMAWAYTEGLHANGIAASYKHFPGHGGTVEDSHSGYAFSYKTKEELEEAELVPFRSGSDHGVDFIMVSHISVPEVTGDNIPASLSKVLVTDLLRNEIGYQGIVITDSLSMGAISQEYTSAQAAVLALQAGCDMLLMPQDFQTAYQAVLDAVADGTISEERIDESVRRIFRLKIGMK